MKKYKTSLFILVLVLGLFGLAKGSRATIYIDENWDTGTPPAGWPCKNIPTSCTTGTFNGWYGRTWDCTVLGGAASGLSTSIYHSSPRSYYMEREPNASYAGNVYTSFPGNPTKMHLRFYVYFPSAGIAGWNQWTHNNLEAYDDMNHWIHINTALAATDKVYVDLMDISHGGGWPPPCWTSGVDTAFLALRAGQTDFNASSAYCGFNVYDNLDKWVCLEFMWDRVNGKYALWIDGIQRVGTGGNGVDQSFAGVTKFDMIYFDSFRSGGQPYIAHGSSYYIDDIVVSDSYIGPTGTSPDTTPPAAPTGVRVS